MKKGKGEGEGEEESGEKSEKENEKEEEMQKRKGVNIKGLVDKIRGTPFHIATTHHAPKESFELLLGAGADLEAIFEVFFCVFLFFFHNSKQKLKFQFSNFY